MHCVGPLWVASSALDPDLWPTISLFGSRVQTPANTGLGLPWLEGKVC